MQEKETKSKYSHMTSDDRVKIESGLNCKLPYKEIAENIHKSATTVSREVAKHSVIDRSGGWCRRFNDCIHRENCPMSFACDKHKDCTRKRCVNCKAFCCTSACKLYEQKRCTILMKPPYVCNGCPGEKSCTLEKRFYRAYAAYEEYRTVLSESRQVLKCGEEELAILDATLQKGFRQGQALNTIFVAAGDEMPICRSTAYNYINNGVFRNSIRLDEPKAVRYRKPYRPNSKPSSRTGSSIPREVLEGHTYADFLVLKRVKTRHHVEMDCVEGKRDGNGRALLTLLFSDCNLQLAYIMENKDTHHVAKIHEMLRDVLGIGTYTRLFDLILTDRGTEFSDCPAFESGPDGEFYTEVYYCDPMNSNQKASCERNHSEIRRVIPKSTDIVCGQDKISFMMDNINSMPRPMYANKSAYEMFCFLHGQDAADALGLVRIPAEDVTLKPYILL